MAFYIGLISITLFSASMVWLVSESAIAVALVAFAAVVGGAVMITFGAESSQVFVSQAFAAAIIALLQLSPEFVVEATIAHSGKVDLMLANFTGSNRLLMGVGWPMIYAVAAFYHRRMHRAKLRYIELRQEVVIEALILLLPSCVFIAIMIKGYFSMFDAIVLAAVFFIYLFLLQRLPPEGKECEDDMVPPCKRVVRMSQNRAKLFIAFLMLAGLLAIVLSAKPFVRSLETIATSLGVSAFFFIQWVAPFLSEFPEKVSAFYWAMRIKLAPMALMNLISSNVNQWTLLVLFIPTFYSLGQGSLMNVPVDSFLRSEIMLTIAMTMYGACSVLKTRFTWFNASVLFSLWFVQFLFPTEIPGASIAPESIGWLVDTRYLVSLAFGGFTAIELWTNRGRISIAGNLRHTIALIARKS